MQLMQNGFLEGKVFFIRQAFTRSPIQIQINKKIIEFGSRKIWEIIEASVCVIYLSLQLRPLTQISALVIPHIVLDLI